MGRDEAMGRRYCAIRGDDPDELYDGVENWQHALVDMRASVSTLESFQIYVDWYDAPSTDYRSGQLSLGFERSNVVNIVSR